MGQTHSAKKSQLLSSISRRKDEKRLFYLGVKRKRTKSPLKGTSSEICKRVGREKERAPRCQTSNILNLHVYENNSYMAAFFKLFGESLIL